MSFTKISVYLQTMQLLLQLKWKIFCRVTKQIPIGYTVFLLLCAAALSFVLLKIEAAVTWKSLLAAAGVHVALCSLVRYSDEKRQFLKQYKQTLFVSYVADFLLLSLPFFLINPFFGMATVATAFLYGMYRSLSLQKRKMNVVIPSPFFVKSSFLWHAKTRYLFPTVWISMLIFIIIGYVHQNPNLAFAALAVGALAILSTIFQIEKADFIQIYINEWHFMRRTLIETLCNSTLFLLPFTILLLFLFPENWLITLLVFACAVLLNINALWLKYAFYPSLLIAFIMLIMSLFFLGGLTIALYGYGVILIPIYFAFLFRFCKNNIRQILNNNERIDN